MTADPARREAEIAAEIITGPRSLFALKHGDTFLVADAIGDILGDADGMFRDDTRVLSRFRLTLAGRAPSLLGGAVSQDNVFFTANLTNRPLPPLGGHEAPEGVIHVERVRFLWCERLYERITLENYGMRDMRVPLAFEFAADFRDMFEVCGKQRRARGRLATPEIFEQCVTLRYEGLDRIERRSVIAFSSAPSRLLADRAEFLLSLPNNGTLELYVEVGPTRGETPGRERFRSAAAKGRFGMRGVRRSGASLRSSGTLFTEWIDKSRADLALLTTELPTGPYPYAGIPWFSTAFGRDAIVTALQTLWLDPALARGVLRYLSLHQARETSDFHHAAPGKIMHETRKGEMTELKELPFGRYYGGVDTTPLFVMLAGAYAERTGDLDLIEELWPSLLAAMEWIEGEMALGQDGLLHYQPGTDPGLVNQGWKDSSDSIFHADGHFPAGAIALVEVQGYAFGALQAMSVLAKRRKDASAAARWGEHAERLRRAVEDLFWMEEAGFYALARDGERRQCAVRGSNAGHLLYVGAAAPERGRRAASHLLSASFNSGWGIRTLARGEARFNPMSYHNGSVWPHDTALCAAGMARYGERAGAVRLLGETFEAAVHFDMRLPELFCGFPRVRGEPPIAYPVACLPQAWAAGAAFMLLQSCLGVRIDAWRNEVHVERPDLPPGVDQLTLRGLRLGDEQVDLLFRREDGRIVVTADGLVPRTIKALAHV